MACCADERENEWLVYQADAGIKGLIAIKNRTKRAIGQSGLSSLETEKGQVPGTSCLPTRRRGVASWKEPGTQLQGPALAAEHPDESLYPVL